MFRNFEASTHLQKDSGTKRYSYNNPSSSRQRSSKHKKQPKKARERHKDQETA